MLFFCRLENIIDFPAGRIISRRMTTYERIESPSPKTYNCSLCKAIFWTEDLLNVHKKDCHIVYCNTCGRLFESIQGLSRHMVFAHKTIQPRY